MPRLSSPLSFRLGPDAARDLAYLAILQHRSEGAVVRDLIQWMARRVWEQVVAESPAFADDPTLVHNGGLIITRQEQEAWRHLTRTE